MSRYRKNISYWSSVPKGKNWDSKSSNGELGLGLVGACQVPLSNSIRASKPACVRVKRLNRRKTSLAAYFIHIYLWQGITGVPGGSVIDEDTSPGPV